MPRVVPQTRCCECGRIFCCPGCREKHEISVHEGFIRCSICRGEALVAFNNQCTIRFVEHIANRHLPLHCVKCFRLFRTKEDLLNSHICTGGHRLAKAKAVFCLKIDDLPTSGYVEKILNENNNVGVETESQFPCVNSTVQSTNCTPDINILMITTSTPMHHQTATMNIFRVSAVDAQVSDIKSQCSDTESPPIQPNDASELLFTPEYASSSSFKLPPSVKNCVGIKKGAIKKLSALTGMRGIISTSRICESDSARKDVKYKVTFADTPKMFVGLEDNGGSVKLSLTPRKQPHVNNPRFDAIRLKFEHEAANRQLEVISGEHNDDDVNKFYKSESILLCRKQSNFRSFHNRIFSSGTFVSGSLDSAAKDSFPEDLYVTANFSSRLVNELHQTQGTFKSLTSDSRSVDEELKTPASFRSVTTDSCSINEVWETPVSFETIPSESCSINRVWETPVIFRPIPSEQEVSYSPLFHDRIFGKSGSVWSNVANAMRNAFKGIPGLSHPKEKDAKKIKSPPSLTSIHSSTNATNIAKILLHRRTFGTKRRRSASFQTLIEEGSGGSSPAAKRQRNERIRGRQPIARMQRHNSN